MKSVELLTETSEE